MSDALSAVVTHLGLEMPELMPVRAELMRSTNSMPQNAVRADVAWRA